MTPNLTSISLDIQNNLQNLRDLADNLVKPAYDVLIPADLALATNFWDTYNPNERNIGYRACLLLWTASKRTMVPRTFQVEATIALMTGRDSLIDVGTGYGKTLCMIIPCLMRPMETAIIISPLKRLQIMQVLQFEQYGIKVLAINEDTPRDPELWKKIVSGYFSALIVQPEQMFLFAGHLPRLAKLMTHDRLFLGSIKRWHVDEGHFIYTAGTSLYGLPAFRPSWGKLGEMRVKLGTNVPVQVLSGTQPPHIKKVIQSELQLDDTKLCSITLSSNRPNTIYATHPIVGDLSDFQNINFLVPEDFPDDYRLPKILVFHDDTEEAASAALYLDRRLPTSLQHTGVIRHYHGGMSKEYLTQVYEDFSNPNGTCRILHATEGASTGLDISDIDIVIQYGISRDVSTTLQRGGRCGRTPTAQALFLIMYESWVNEIDLENTVTSIINNEDPDYPNSGLLTKYSTKISRLGIAVIRLIQQKDICLRQFFALYLNDTTDDALKFSMRWCCDRHPESGFQIGHFFKGKLLYQDGTLDLFYGAPDDAERVKILPPPKPKRSARKKSRLTKQRGDLLSSLLSWRSNAHKSDALAAVRPASFIIDDKSIKKLCSIHPTSIINPAQVTAALGETTEWEEEWGQKIFEVILAYDKNLLDQHKSNTAERKLQQKRQKIQKDQQQFTKESNSNIERISAQTALRFQQSVASGSSRIVNVPETRRSMRLQQHQPIN